MRKQLKNKKRACGLCKPYKRGMENRWKPKDRTTIKNLEKEAISGYLKTINEPS